MSTTSTPVLEDTLRTRLLTHTRLSGSTLAEILGTAPSSGSDGKLYKVQAPDNATYPYGVMRLMNRRTSGDIAEREVAELEVMLFGRPRSQQATMEGAADACDEALLPRYVDASSGVVACTGRTRNTMPVFAEPADREVVQIRLVYTLIVYPQNIAQYADT